MLQEDFEDSDQENDDLLNPKSLEDLMNSPSFSQVISTPVNKTPGELLLMILTFSLMNQLTQNAVSNLFKLFNNIFVSPILPDSKHMINKYFCYDEVEFHVSCPHCSAYVKQIENFKDELFCEICNTLIDISGPSCTNVFALINPVSEISEKLNTYSNHYFNVINNRQSELGIIKDVYDGSRYRKFVSSLPEETRRSYATFTFNTDGAPTTNSSNYSIWPIYLMINELPITDRFRELITCGIWFGKGKPDMNVFMKPFVKMVKNLANSGVNCVIEGAEHCIKVFPLCCCVDTVARAPFQGIKQFNGHYGCNWYLHYGKSFERSMRYSIVLEPNPVKRDKETHLENIIEFDEDEIEVNSVNSVTPLILLKNSFDIIYGFVPDYLHCYISGVGKQITNHLLTFLSADDIKCLDNLLYKIKIPHQLERLSRPISEKAFWKAREWENWILYYSIPLLSKKFSKSVMNYWSLLVESLYILLQTSISHVEILEVENKLKLFVQKTEQYFGLKAMTINVHQLLHIVKSIKHWGPLWAHSCYPFESENYQILNAIHSSKGVNLQLLKFLNLKKCIQKLEKQILPDATAVIKKYCRDMTGHRAKNSFKISNLTYMGKVNIEMSEDNRRKLIYKKLIKNGCLYTSCLKINKRSNNSIACLNDGRFVRLIKFIIVGSNEFDEVTLCNIIRTAPQNLSNHFSQLKFVIDIEENTTLISTNSIKSVAILINNGNQKYVCSLPNLLHY